MLLRFSLGTFVYFSQLNEDDSFLIFMQLVSFKQYQKARHTTVLSSRKITGEVFIIMGAGNKDKKNLKIRKKFKCHLTVNHRVRFSHK